MGLDTKTDRQTDRQLQCDFDPKLISPEDDNRKVCENIENLQLPKWPTPENRSHRLSPRYENQRTGSSQLVLRMDI
jgi:hypothetical protein